MRKFKDQANREWEVCLTYSTVKRCREGAGIDILDVGNADDSQNSLARMFQDPIFVADVLFELCHKQRESERLSRDDFCEAVIEVTPDARQALLEELHDFFHRAQMSDHCALVSRGQQMMAKLTEAQREKMATTDVDELVKQLLA